MIACDTHQLHRIERSIAALECRSEADQMRLQWMREVLRFEKRKLLGIDVAARTPPLPPEIIGYVRDSRTAGRVTQDIDLLEQGPARAR